MKVWIFSRSESFLCKDTPCCHCVEWVKCLNLNSKRYQTVPNVFSLKKNKNKKKRELVKNERLHLERSSVMNQVEKGPHIALFPFLLLGNWSSS